MRRIAYCVLALVPVLGAADVEQTKVRISWGHKSPKPYSYFVKPEAGSAGVEIRAISGASLEPGEGLKDGAWQGRAGGGDVDGVEFTLACPAASGGVLQNLHVIWADLIAASDTDTALRLTNDAAFEPGAPRLRVLMNAEGTRGFTVTSEQLRREKAFWIPSLDVYVAAGDAPAGFASHEKSIESRRGLRILERAHREPEASYEQYKKLWEDMGSPAYLHPNQPAPGHIVCLTWDSAIPKFGIDRGAGVWNDYGNPDRFRFWLDVGDLARGVLDTWKSQRLEQGLPVITTVFERGGVRYEVEQFAFPLEGPPSERKGDLSMVLLEKVRMVELLGRARRVPLTFHHRRLLPAGLKAEVRAEREGGTILVRDHDSGAALLAVDAAGEFGFGGVRDYQREQKRVELTVFADLPARGSRQFVVKLPSPVVSASDIPKLKAIEYPAARAAALQFWSGWVERGAQFRAPEKAVNELFRATLWHALRLPRRHGGANSQTIDLPYSNFAYSQTGTPWPVNQAVYVDYMLYDLRGYHGVSSEELAAQFRNNQESDGHLKGVANWLVYTPGMLYATAENYLLSDDRAAFERLLPACLKALDWCLAALHRAAEKEGPARGLVSGPLNDGTGEGIWAFNQAYLFAGLDLFARALERAGHPRAAESREGARLIYDAIDRGFHEAAARSPLVQLRDHTWIPYVPGEAATHRRLLDIWYPTDVDTGAVHLIRLKAVAPGGDLADYLLNDHEDNLFYKGLGIANEPVYNQQATAYLLRDDPKAAIRAFYSYMASAFSHSVYEPVEHRWTHGQYFGPPSTDGAWFELYRNMLVSERDNGGLVLAQATPRAWLRDGAKIEIERAPTWYGPVSLTIESRANSGSVTARLEVPGRGGLRELFVRLRHPEGKRMQAVTVDGRGWKDFDPAKEWVRMAAPSAGAHTVVARY